MRYARVKYRLVYLIYMLLYFVNSKSILKLKNILEKVFIFIQTFLSILTDKKRHFAIFF